MQSNITLKQCRYFLAISEATSLAAAARMINIAQSALTKSVQELENALGVNLFERSSRGMVLTRHGHRFQASARKVIAAVAEASMLGEPEETALAGSLAIGVTSLVAGYYLADLYARFMRSHPSVNLTLVEDKPQFLEHLLVNGEIDLAVMVVNDLSERRALVVETLISSTNRVWVPSNHRFVAKTEVSLAECLAEPQIVLESDRIDTVMRAVWARQQQLPTTRLRTSSLEAVRSLVGVGAGIAVLPDFLYRPWTLDADHIDVRPLRDAIPAVDVGLVWRRSAKRKIALDEFVEMAQEQSRASRSKA
jgi:DNA-binding transcriptional LysR family regulator